METLDTTCRLCLTPTPSDYVSLFDTNGEVQYCSQIMRWSSIVVSEDDGLPGRICRECADLLHTASNFLSRCEAADQTLRSQQTTINKELGEPPTIKDIECDVAVFLDETHFDGHHTDRSCEGEEISENNSFKTDKCYVPDSTDSSYNSDVKLKSNLKRHPRRLRRKRRREMERLFQCDHCEESYKTNKALLTHVKTRHQRERGFTCETCGSRFYTKALLLRHQLIHTGVKPHQCQLCGKAFLSKIILNQHMKNHTSERKYICHLCDKAFKTRHGLTKHINKTMTHSNEKLKRVSCNICNVTFSVKSSLATHIKKKHVENLN